jgi:YfiH family protein
MVEEVPAELELVDAALPGAVAGFTTRVGGVSGSRWESLNLALHVDDDARLVRANRERLARRLGSRPVSFPEQVHGAGVLAVGRGRADRSRITNEGAPGVDALVTAETGLPLGVLVADCLPVLLVDPVARVAGAAHAGRRGRVAGVLQQAVAAMVELGAVPARTAAVIGPAVCGRCYELPAAMRDEVEAAVPGSATLTRVGTPASDLPGGARRVLETLGLAAVREIGICTVEDARFYSHRRDGVTGRFAGVVMLTGDD